MTTRSPPTECHFNMHKSNSTYFTDLDMLRAHLTGLIFSAMLWERHSTDGATCSWARSLACSKKTSKPQQTYELWTRVASWDDKWLYMITHFVVPSSRRRERSLASSSSQASGTERAKKGGSESPHDQPHKKNHEVLASGVTRMVFKKGRLTVTPAQAISACHATALLDAQGDTRDSGPRDTQFASITVSDKANCGSHEPTRLDLEALESLRKASLPIVQLHRGWDAVHALFDDTRDNVLARHQDLIF
ncbi:Putative HotDog domain superfamily protein [Colletotrichum destructivum]|uniref:HotDog domain superfamily protein n=1 Tax=Colletotrichum destructivum TaxID=34406 RepID=A0AAX4ICG5_9PEZI|nr:Putative HotDog domain superfamily protein [Colletotrichum destructivum]